jgi:formylglycine-generating enzyme required for sulfatase activity
VRATASGATRQPARRVVRGGSWNNNQNNARAAYRNNNHPNNRNNNIGFRLVRRPTSKDLNHV